MDAFLDVAPGFEQLVFVGFFAGNEGLGHPASAFWVDAHGGEGIAAECQGGVVGFDYHVVGAGFAQFVAVAAVEGAGQYPDLRVKLFDMTHQINGPVAVINGHNEQACLGNAGGFQ